MNKRFDPFTDNVPQGQYLEIILNLSAGLLAGTGIYLFLIYSINGI